MTVAETAVPVIRCGDPQVRRRPHITVAERDQDLAAVSRSADQAACCRLAHRPTCRDTGPDNHDGRCQPVEAIELARRSAKTSAGVR
jgi:hypothetical protein